jgi:hypothetical protein
MLARKRTLHFKERISEITFVKKTDDSGEANGRAVGVIVELRTCVGRKIKINVVPNVTVNDLRSEVLIRWVGH